MKKWFEENNGNDYLYCALGTADVAAAEKEFRAYMAKNGKTYELDTRKEPWPRTFVALYFGTNEDDEYGYYTAPDKYICTNKNVADRVMRILSYLEYHDTFEQTWCQVLLDGKNISVIRGDY